MSNSTRKFPIEVFSENSDQEFNVEPLHFPLRACFISESGGGKTTVILNVVFNYLNSILKRVILVSGKPETAEKFKQIFNDRNPDFELTVFNEFDEEKLTEIMDEVEQNPEPTLFIFEDMTSFNISKKVSNNILDRISSNGRASQIGMIISAQRYTDLAPTQRSNNCSILFLFERPQEIKRIFDEHNTGLSFNKFEKIVNKHTADRFDFVVIDRTKPKGERLLDSDMETIPTDESSAETLTPSDAKSKSKTHSDDSDTKKSKKAKIKFISIRRHPSIKNKMKANFEAEGKKFSVVFGRDDVGEMGKKSAIHPTVIASMIFDGDGTLQENIEQYRKRFDL